MPAQLPQLPQATDLISQMATFLGRGDVAAGTDAGLFAAQFQALLGKQPVSAEAANPVAAIIDTARAIDPELDEDLAALLPFIEALGLTQTLPTESVPLDPAHLAAAESQPADAAAAALTVPLTPAAAVPAGAPAISAANGHPPLQSQSAGQFTPAAQVMPDALDSVPATPVSAVGMTPNELAAGREFSTQLVAALTAGKEAPQAPGAVAAAAQQVITQANPAHTQASQGGLAITQPVGTPGWTEEIGNHIAWLANKSESRADLVLTPPQMGRVEISLSIKGDQAAASFVSSNPVVRETLEAALPRLREVLADAGIQLGQAQISAENPRQWAQQEKHGENFASDRNRELPGHAAISSVSSGSLSTVAGLKAGRGLVDVFA